MMPVRLERKHVCRWAKRSEAAAITHTRVKSHYWWENSSDGFPCCSFTPVRVDDGDDDDDRLKLSSFPNYPPHTKNSAPKQMICIHFLPLSQDALCHCEYSFFCGQIAEKNYTEKVFNNVSTSLVHLVAFSPTRAHSWRHST